MELTKEICKIIAELEYLIGSECYNPNSYDGYNDIEGCKFRYPINIRSGERRYIKIKSNINKSPLIDRNSIDKDSILHMKYKFGSNELRIGSGLIKVLNYLEERYGIDFEELEKGSE